MSARATAFGVRSRFPAVLIRGVLTIFVGTLLCLTAATSIIVLGWQMALMRARANRVA